jgi:adenosylmethionine-8-amino-7-oxononanoate aminotransferase
MILMEPVQNHGGMLVPPAGYSKGVREIADKYGILVVADETITAFAGSGPGSAPSATRWNPTSSPAPRACPPRTRDRRGDRR